MPVSTTGVGGPDDGPDEGSTSAPRVASSPGFEAFELLRPTDDRDTYLVYTRWRSQEDFDAWLASPAFGHGHRAHNTEGPVSSESALWSFDVVQHEEPAQA